MVLMRSDFLGIGLTDKSLTDLERRIISETSPYAVVLFGRNIGGAEQLCDLVREVKSLARRPPIFMIDEEGGRVDRLRHLVPGLPSAEAFGEGQQPLELSGWLGRLIGIALRYFDIEVDLAPVVDIRGDSAPKGLERRTFGRDPETVIELAGAFMRGLHETGTASCLKHFPGIGAGSADPHYGATVIDVGLEELTKRDLVPFARLGNEAGAIMIGHGNYPQIDEPDLPATLSRRISTELLRDVAGFEGLAVTDDMEMHAVSDFGAYETITERSMLAGNDVLLFCSHIERVPDIQRFVRDTSQRDAKFAERLREAAARAQKYRAHIDRLRRAAPPPVKNFDAVIDEAVRFVDRFEKTRPEGQVYEPAVDRRKDSRKLGTGRTGREEWT
jgi:beta-N-acetylhexosaminidase